MQQNKQVFLDNEFVNCNSKIEALCQLRHVKIPLNGPALKHRPPLWAPARYAWLYAGTTPMYHARSGIGVPSYTTSVRSFPNTSRKRYAVA